MEKKSACFPFRCVQTRHPSHKSSHRMPTLREFLSKNVSIGTQTSDSNQNPSASSVLKSSSSHKSSIMFKKSIPRAQNDSVNTLNLSRVSKIPNLSNNTLLISRNSFEEIFNCKSTERVKAKNSESISRPFVLSDSKLRVVPITPKKRRSSYGSRVGIKEKSSLINIEVRRVKRMFSNDWKKELDEIVFK